MLCCLSAYERQQQDGDLGRAGELASKAEELAIQSGDLAERVHALCEREFIELASGRRAGDILDALGPLAKGATLPTGSAKQIESLTRASEALARGAPLLFGQLADDVPPGLRRIFAGTDRRPAAGPGARVSSCQGQEAHPHATLLVVMPATGLFGY